MTRLPISFRRLRVTAHRQGEARWPEANRIAVVISSRRDPSERVTEAQDFRQEAVRLYRVSGRSFRAVADELQVTDEARTNVSHLHLRPLGAT
jgi:hypothetical protein